MPRRFAPRAAAAVIACLSLALSGFSLPAAAEEIVLRAVSAFGQNTFFNQRFRAFVDKVNATGGGIMKIEIVGGPDSLSPFEIGNALSKGEVDLANTSGAFHANLVPEALALSYTDKNMSELRANGGYALMDKLHRDKGNMVWLGRLSEGLKYHIYLSKKISGADLGGLRLRSAPAYRAFFQAQGATPLQMAPGSVYAQLEKGTVDGYGWPSIGIFDLRWNEKTKYRLEPGFYNVEVGLYLNQDVWNRLDEEQRAFLQKQVAWVEAQTANDLKLEAAEKARQARSGIEAITLPPAQADAFRQAARETGWGSLEEASPEHVEELRALF